MTTLHRLLTLGLLLAAVVPAARAQVCSPEVPLRRTLPVNVLDAQGNLVRGLTAADFRASFRGQPVKILSVTRAAGSRRIVILLDVSGSMATPKSKWGVARMAAEDVAAYAPPGSSVALVAFSDRVNEKLDFAVGREALLRKVSEMDSDSIPGGGKGRTALLDALAESLGMLDKPELGDAVFAITDGGENSSRIRRKQAEGNLLHSEARFFFFLLRSPLWEHLAANELAGGVGMLDDLRKASGGYSVNVWPTSVSQLYETERFDLSEEDRAAIRFLTHRLYQQMGEFYSVEVVLPEGLSKPQGWKLEVLGENGKRRKDVEVVYPRKLVPCTSSPAPQP